MQKQKTLHMVIHSLVFNDDVLLRVVEVLKKKPCRLYFRTYNYVVHMCEKFFALVPQTFIVKSKIKNKIMLEQT